MDTAEALNDAILILEAAKAFGLATATVTIHFRLDFLRPSA